MCDSLAHRGPDDAGTWAEPEQGVWFGHRRLAVLDLTPEGHQPMLSASGRYVIVFNGEIYNYRELRTKLEQGNALSPGEREKYVWRGHSDTEVILAACEAWGVHAALKQIRGMFAFALWDKKTHTLTLARDRIGEKPLYFGLVKGVLIFASELKALRAHPAFSAAINRNVLALFLRHNYVPGPYTIYEGIHKLPPGCEMSITADDLRRRELPPVQPYWQAREICERGQRERFNGSDAEAVHELEMLLGNAVGGQMISDVPLGAFLSGGVDSSVIAALMQAQSRRPVKTFTIGFTEQGYDEAPHARAVARHLGTEHTELYVTPQEARDVIPLLPTIYDEPFADSSQIPTFLVARMARRDVTVCLSGDGGDELFGGYNRYFWTMNLGPRWAGVPRPLRAALAGMLTRLPAGSWDRFFSVLNRFLPRAWRYANPGDKLHKLAGILTMSSAEETYMDLVSHWKSPANIIPGACEPPTVLTEKNKHAQLREFEHWMMSMDLVSYLPDDILVKVDRAAMAVSLETRTPFLDHRVVEFAWRLPLAMKIRNGTGKWLLRQLLYKYVPREMVDRPKTGFGVPIDQWLRGPLREWAETLLDAGRLTREGYFNPVPIRQKWEEHLSGCQNWAYHLWDVLLFQSWLECQHAR